MVEQVGQAELEEWLGKGEGMAYSLRREAGELLERSKTLLKHAKKIEAIVKRKGGGCEDCGAHRSSKIHREKCGSGAEEKR